jgi:hypothetical protein
MVPAGAADTPLSPDQLRQSLTSPILPLSVGQGRCEGARAQVYWNAMNNRCGISIIGLVGRTTAETTRDPEAKRSSVSITTRASNATMDLLTVRYFQLTDPNNATNFERNAGPEHSGLPLEDLTKPKLVLDSYKERLSAAVSSVRTEPLVVDEAERRRRSSLLLPTH